MPRAVPSPPTGPNRSDQARQRRLSLDRSRRLLRPPGPRPLQPPSSSRPPFGAPQALRVAPDGAAPHDPPCAGRGRLARPRWTTSGSSRPSPGTGTARAPLCSSDRARGRARRPGSSSATVVTALPSCRPCSMQARPSILAHHRPDPPEPGPACSSADLSSPRVIFNRATSVGPTSRRRARSKALRLAACSKQRGESRHSQAPRPCDVVPTTSEPPAVTTTRTMSSAAPAVRQPMQVRIGAMPVPPRSPRRFAPPLPRNRTPRRPESGPPTPRRAHLRRLPLPRRP